MLHLHDLNRQLYLALRTKNPTIVICWSVKKDVPSAVGQNLIQRFAMNLSHVQVIRRHSANLDRFYRRAHPRENLKEPLGRYDEVKLHNASERVSRLARAKYRHVELSPTVVTYLVIPAEHERHVRVQKFG